MAQINPYLSFPGTCEEAMDFYKDVFGGSVEYNRFEGSPMAGSVGADYQTKIMHATLTGDGFSFMGSDGPPDFHPSAGENVSLSYATTDEPSAITAFEKLAKGGTVTMPLAKQFWGAVFGTLTDRFGIHWMFNISPL